MKRLLLVGLLALSVPGAWSDDLPPILQEAVDLELQGRLTEALDRYRAALSAVPDLLQDEALSDPLTIRVFSKAAHLSIDLGYGEEAWDLGGRLWNSKTQKAAEAGTLVRLRLLRLQGRWTEALAAFDAYAASWPLPPPGAALLTEVQRVLQGSQRTGTTFESLIRKGGGPASWVLDRTMELLPSPSDAWRLNVQETVRVQVGAFRDWVNALTLIDMLKEKGWAPFTEVRTGQDGSKLHVVYVVSRQPEADRARLEAQGLLAP